MPSPNPRELKVANIGTNLRPRSATRDLRATRRAPGQGGSQFDDRLRIAQTHQHLGTTGEHVRVFPAIAEFRDTEPNVTHILTITVVNRSDHVKRIRFKPPLSEYFKLHQIPSVSVAPGLEISADLEFFTTTVGDLSDELVVICEGSDKITIPVRAYAPRADLFFDGFCHFGSVAPGSVSIRYVDFVNRGTTAADFRFLNNKGNTFEIEPLMGRLGPVGSDDCFMRVRVQFHAKDVGMFRSIVQVEVNSIVIGTSLDMSALSARQKIELCSPDGTGKLDSLRFGTIYFGEERSQQIVLVNDGPESLEFKSTVPRPESDEGFLDPVFSVLPDSSIATGFEQKALTVSFHPKREDNPQKGWRAAKVEPPKKDDHNVEVKFVSSGNFDPKVLQELTADIKFIGQAVSVQVSLSEYDIEFLDTRQYDNVDVSVTIKNHHEELPIGFVVPKIAQFRCRPAAGRLLPFQSMLLVVSFCPNNRGQHKGELNFSLRGATGQVVGDRVISLRGNCHEIGQMRKLAGGTLATHETFYPVLQFQTTDQVLQQKQTVATRFVREKVWVKNPPEVSDSTIKYTMDASAFEKIHLNKETYNVFVKEEYAKRKAKLVMTEKSSFALGNPADVACGDAKEDPDYAKSALDMGMFSLPVNGAPAGLALNEPRLSLPEANEPLYLKSNFGIKTVLKPRTRFLDEDKLIVKKLKPHPTTGKEKRECSERLPARNILQISTHPSKFLFGAICIQQECAKCFSVSNGTENSIFVRIDNHGDAALEKCKPLSQVIPPGVTAGFDIIVCLEAAADLNTKITYIINECHVFEMPVTAQAVPVMLSLNKQMINFIFPPQNFSSMVTESVVLINQGSNMAEYKFSQGKYFSSIPTSGQIGPLQSQDVVVAFKPGEGTSFEETLAIEVLGGNPLALKCAGELTEGSLKVKVKTLDYGALPAGQALRKNLTLIGDAENQSESVWYVDPDEISRRCPGLSIQPEHGALFKDIPIVVIATMRSEREQKIDSSFSIMVRGGKTIKIKVKADIVLPVATVLNDELQFGTTYLGATTVRPLTIKNDSVVNAVFTLDLSKHNEFGFRIPEALEYDDEDSTSMEHNRRVSLRRASGMPKDINDVLAEHGDGAISQEGPCSKFKVPPNSTVSIEMTFTPVALLNHIFELPLSMQGLPPNAMRPLRRAVCAESTRPRLLLSKPSIEFGPNIVVSQGISNFSYHFHLSVTNCDNTEVNIEAYLKGAQVDEGTFVMKPVSMSLLPGKSCTLNIDFIPRKKQQYKCRLLIFLDGQKDLPYFDLDVSGSGLHPSLRFDRREVFLPPAPPGHPQKVTFFVINHGYDNLNLRHGMSLESKHLPISVAFPDGTMLNVVRQRVPVELTVNPLNTTSFTATIEFYDNKDEVYSIQVACTADSSLTSIFPWLEVYQDCYSIESKQTKTGFSPPVLSITKELKNMQLDADGNIILAPVNSPTHSSTRDKLKQKPNASFLCVCKKVSEKASVDFLLEFMNMYVLKQAINKFPQDIHDGKAKMIIEVIEQSTGKAIPGKIKKMPASRKDEAAQTLSYYKEMINTLKILGASISLVREDYLLPYGLFEKLFLDELAVESYSSETLEFLENYYDLVHETSWLLIIYQLVRLFVISRFSTKSMKFLAGIDPKVFPDWSSKKPVASPELDVYSSNELSLLSWLTYHKNKVMPTDKTPVTNFDKDLHDCRVLAYAIISHMPSVRTTLASLKKTEVASERLENATTLIRIMKSIGLDYCPSEEALTTAHGRDLMLFVVYLVDSLPGFIPKTTVEFEGRLNEPVIKYVELNNPSSRPLIYNVRIEGSPEFSAPDSVKIGPREKTKFPGFPITCMHTQRLPAVGESTEAQIYFMGERVLGSPSAATLVFNLKSHVTSFKRTKIFTKETKLYEQITFEVPCKNNSSETDTEINVTLINLNTWPQKGNISPVKGGEKKKKKNMDPTSSHLLPAMTFWTKKSTFKLKKDLSGTALVQFLPLRLAAHSCLVFIRDDFGSETCFELQVKVSLPDQTDFYKFAHPMKSTIIKDVPLNLKNPAIDKCRSAIIELMGKAEGASFFKAIGDANSLDYKVEYLAQGFTGPRELTLWGKTPPPDLGRGQKLNCLQLELKPTGVGLYVTRIILRSALDIRLLDVEAKVTSLGIRAELTLSIPARQQIMQEIPFVNNSEQDWKIIADLQGDGFTGPKDLIVPSKKNGEAGTAFYPLTFKPAWICNISGLLNLRNTTADDKYEYSLTGIGEDPVAEDHLKIKCQARQRKDLNISVRNILPDDDCLYTIECDLIGMTGPQSHFVPRDGTSEYQLTVKMPRGGDFAGSISFKAPNKQFIWFTVEISAENPPSERTIEMETKARSAVAADITISNPLNSEVTFDVIMNGEGLFGERTITLAPHEQSTYELIYSPLLVGFNKGGLTFLNDEIGEFWYSLELTALEGESVVLEDMEAEIGKTSSTELMLENPLGADIELLVHVSNPINFKFVSPTERSRGSGNYVSVSAFSILSAQVLYTASSVGEAERSEITLSHPEAGVWVYEACGRGSAPEKNETVMRVSSKVGRSSSNKIKFRNPFKFAMSTTMKLIGDVNVPEDAPEGTVAAFRIAMRETTNVVLIPFQELEVPIIFVPNRMTEHKCQLEVYALEHNFRWVYPIVGTAEVANATYLGTFTCKARDSLVQSLEVKLDGAKDLGERERLDFEVVTPAEAGEMMAKCLTIERDPDNPGGGDLCRLKIVFEPLKSVRCKVNLLITRRSGGRWRFDLDLVASQPEVDDEIRIEGHVNRTSSVSFRITNQFDTEAPFKAYFSSESPPEFAVTPTTGMLEPYGSEGTNFVVSFSPKGYYVYVWVYVRRIGVYGKFYQGKLIVETDDMQWTYDVIGEHPRYDPPQVSRKVDTWIPPEADPEIYKTQQSPQNYMQQNLQLVRRMQAATQASPVRSPARRGLNYSN